MNESDASAPGPGEGSPRPEKGPEKKGLRRRISWRRAAALREEELARAQAELAACKDRFLRLSAEFQNYRRRVEQEGRALREEAKGRALADLFPLFDLLELALAASKGGGSLGDLVAGLGMIQAQWREVLAGAGVTELEALGLPFDPGLHEAVQLVEAPEVPPGTVVAVVRPGYKTRERVLRFARVVVSAPPSRPAEESDPAAGSLSGEAAAPAEEPHRPPDPEGTGGGARAEDREEREG